MSEEAPRRIPLTTPAASAAAALGCYAAQVGPCVRACDGLTARYGSPARTICPACRHEEALADAARQRG
ncbi:hypothetical protein [Streptomyces lydicus]|uniref:hypothetical protein n=1 Tax=Streptomyces lydicus TaxID=47763 RepID=UPI001012FE8F|nr:hypothetical protein [Streptomyces lydicus]MCZ1011935.1 hypothetical protein [Streptomyces lydicus]